MATEYPTDEQLLKVKNWDTLTEGVKPLVQYIESLWWEPDWGFILRKAYRQARKLELHTGGWSGNESIIASLMSNVSFWNLYWEKSTVGGHYWFIIPEEDWEREEMKSTGKEKAEMKEVRQEEKVQQGS